MAIRVAIVIPETGLAEDPTKPTMRELTVTNKNPKTTTRSEAARFGRPSYEGSGYRLELKEDEHADNDEHGADENDFHG